MIAALASGTGTILEALISAELPIEVVLVDRPCAAEKVAERAGIPIELVERSFAPGFDRDAYSESILAALAPHRPRLIAMAGFGTVLGAAVLAAHAGRILNTHPSLLPAFKGWHAVAQALGAGVSETGCTVHIATLEVDAGPILAQEAVPVYSDDDESTLHERIKQVERRLYPTAIRCFLAGMQAAGASRGDKEVP